MGEVRKALLSAGVHFRTAREFVDQVKEACLGQEVLKSVSPGQQVVKIIHDELIKLLGEGTTELREDRPLRFLWLVFTERKDHHERKAGQAVGQGRTLTHARCLRRLSSGRDRST